MKRASAVASLAGVDQILKMLVQLQEIRRSSEI